MPEGTLCTHGDCCVRLHVTQKRLAALHAKLREVEAEHERIIIAWNKNAADALKERDTLRAENARLRGELRRARNRAEQESRRLSAALASEPTVMDQLNAQLRTHAGTCASEPDESPKMCAGHARYGLRDPVGPCSHRARAGSDYCAKHTPRTCGTCGEAHEPPRGWACTGHTPRTIICLNGHHYVTDTNAPGPCSECGAIPMYVSVSCGECGADPMDCDHSLASEPDESPTCGTCEHWGGVYAITGGHYPSLRCLQADRAVRHDSDACPDHTPRQESPSPDPRETLTRDRDCEPDESPEETPAAPPVVGALAQSPGGAPIDHEEARRHVLGLDAGHTAERLLRYIDQQEAHAKEKALDWDKINAAWAKSDLRMLREYDRQRFGGTDDE